MRATKVNAGLAESNGRLLLGIRRDSLHVTCGLTACTPGSAPGPTLGNEYGKTLPFTFSKGGSVAEWLACWTRAQLAWVQLAAATLSGNSLRQTVHTHRASVHQAAKLLAALLGVAMVTAGLAESNGNLYDTIRYAILTCARKPT